jgi:hypothetical protein
MNDFTELENELKKLRPTQPSPVLFERIREALKGSTQGISAVRSKWWRFKVSTPQSATKTDGKFVTAGERKPPSRGLYGNGWSLGFGLAAATVLLLLAMISMERRQDHEQTVAQSLPAPQTAPSPFKPRSTSRSRFVPDGGSNLVYNARDEGLHFADGSERPVRRVRYNTQQTWRWRNPETGASLRVSYPSEEVVLIPVSGQ